MMKTKWGISMRVFITGITGMVGSHLLDYLIKNTDWEIHGLIRWRSSLENISSHLDAINRNERIFLHYGDLNDSYSLNNVISIIKPNYVFHLAAQSYPLTSFNSPEDTFNTNILGTLRLLQSLKLYAKDAFIHLCSSSEVYGRVPSEFVPIKEETNYHPASPYAISKIGTDLLGRFYYEAYNMNIITTRMFTHTGPRRGDVFAESSFAKQIALIEQGKSSKILKVGNLDSLRTYADVRDAVDAYYKLLTVNPIPGEFYNIGGTYTCTVGEMLDHLLSLSFVKDIKIVEDKERIRPIDADLQVPDSSKFKKHTNWSEKYSFEETMEDLLNYWREKISKGEYLER
jgi:GDP-mannose 4,6-dehydratase